MRTRATTEGDRPGPDRGTTVLEAAIALPVCFLLFLGLFGAGTLMKAYSSTTAAVRSAGRMASLSGADPMADQLTIARFAREAAGIRPDPVDYVIIWHPAAPADKPPAACIPATFTTPNTTSMGVTDGGTDTVGACTVYVRPTDPGGAFDMAQGLAAHPASYYFGCQGASDPAAAHMVDCRWPGKDRRALATPRSASGPPVPPDFIGVYVQVTHRFGGDLFGKVVLHQGAINLIEPRGYALS